MSGKPASVGASRAAAAGASRVLVYVEPHQLEAGGAAPSPARSDHQRPPSRSGSALFTHSDQRNLHNTVYYKPHHNSDPKLALYSSSDSFPHRTELYPASQPYETGLCPKSEELRSEGVAGEIKQDSAERVGGGFSSVQVFQGRIPDSDPGIYQTRCSGPLSADTMPSMQQVALRHGHNQYSESVTVHSEGSTNDREVSVGKSYVNYQILEQSVSHQSIVNQSISILNQQVGVNRGIDSESGSGNTPQLVRTAEGVVLAVLPAAPVISQPTDTLECSRTALSDIPQTITVPLGWRRIISGTSVLYLSPSGTALSTLPQLREYLQTTGTCKCGLPCPLRPETAFSFDSKVVSKPYQAASGAELTKLCNHKRKLLATLQARAHSPATPPPLHIEPKKAAGTEVAVLKKKMKKRPGFPANVSVSQLMVQRERPLAEFKPQDNEPTVISQQRAPNGLPVPAYAPTQHMLSQGTQEDPKQDPHIQKSSHYITVNNGWITQQKQEGQKPHHLTAAHPNNPNNSSGMPVRGANGQIIGINTAYAIHPNYKHAPNTVPSNPEPEQKQERKEKPTQQMMQQVKYQREDESQSFCSLNQALTPEVMQKINEQQQIFIQQNQKQIEMAMKGYRSQHSDTTNQNNPVAQGQYTSQGQLVIQNGAVVKTNPAKTPPWQVKRTDSSNSNPITSPSPKIQKLDNMDYEDPMANMSEDSSSSFSSFSSNEQVIPQGMCSRVPPLPQHYNMISQQWPTIETHKKKGKGAKGGKKKNNAAESKAQNFGNNGIRLAQELKGNPPDMPNNVPSFMDDPSGYLAQQTALLNNTISRQVGMNSTYDGSQFDGSNHSNFGPQHQMDKVRSLPKSSEMAVLYRNVPNASPSPNTTPDSSVVSDNAILQCCKGCNVSAKSNSPDFADNQMRLKYMKHNMYRMELEGNTTSSPKHGFDENPVTSSTFMERNQVHGNCSPIQAGTVSTSNVSETMQPEPSPTPSNGSRNTDTPHSSGSNSQLPPTNYHTQSPAYSNNYKENFNSNPSTPGSYQAYPYNSPGPPASQASGTQMMHFISNHNVNTNLMEVDNISMVGVKPAVKTQELMRLEPRRNAENSMPGYCPPPHMGGGPAYSLIQACYVQTFVTTMASGFSVTRDTVTSVLAGKANTVTTSINAAQANFIRPPPPPSVNMATTYAIPNNQPDPFLNSVNLPTSYPLHIAGTTAQNMISKSPMEMVQNVIGSIPSRSETSHTHTASYPHSQANKRTSSGQILISSTGQIIVPKNQMPPPPPKMMSTVASGHCSTSVSNANALGQSAPSTGGPQSMVNQPTVVVNTLQSPFVIQPPMMSVDGQVVQQNSGMPQLSNIVAGQATTENTRQVEVKSHQSFMQGVAMLSPEIVKKRTKKKKNMTNVLQITAPQQNQNNLMVHSSPQHNSSSQFSPRGFQLSPNNNISPTTPMLQALTIVPGKSGTPAHIVMNGQGNSNNFGSQQIITNTSPSQQINLLQPVNLINNASNVMPNFPAFQQFIVPNLGGMMMTADGTTIIQDNSTGMPMQLQLQTVNGQNVLTPVQNSGVFTGANGGVVIRQNQQGKIIQSQHSPGAQFLSPNSQVMMNSPNFNGQLSPLLANLSPTNVTFNTGQQVRSGNMQAQEFIQTNQMGQTVMVPVSPKQATNNRTNSTFVHQNTTIVQQQTTLVSNSHNTQMSSLNLQGNQSRLSIDPNMLIGKQIVQKSRNYMEISDGVREEGKDKEMKIENSEGYAKFMSEFGPLESGHVRHSVSTQTLRKSPGAQAASGCSPPDTTTHSPLGALEAAASPRLYAQRCASTQGNYADTTTKSPEPTDANSSAMVQCVSSSEQDMAEAREHAWPAPRNDFHTDNESHNMISNMAMLRQSRPHNPVESSELHYNQNMNIPRPHNPHAMPMASNYYERTQTYKRKNDFGDGSTYRSDKIMRTNSYNMVHAPKDNDYDMGIPSDKAQGRHYPSGSGSETGMPRFDRHNLGSSDDGNSGGDEGAREAGEKATRRFDVGDLVWGPVKGYASWPGSLEARDPDGRWRVRWFGACASPPVRAQQLLTLSEGLEAHHAARIKHRKSRKLNTLLENAIQEAMAELDKKSERLEPAPAAAGSSASVLDVAPIAETPKRTKKVDKVKGKDKMAKKNPVKIAPNPHKTGDGARLRSAR